MVTIQDIAIAYRKAKVDMYYSGIPCRSDLVEFEKNLELEFQHLLDVTNNPRFEDVKKLCAGWLLIPKKIADDSDENHRHNDNIVFSDPERQFANRREGQQLKCELRLVAKVPVAFHVLLTLWIQKIGNRAEQKISANSYGNRLRRLKSGELSNYSLGSFKSYMPQYKRWRDGALKSMREANTNGKDVVAITADFTAFYHSLSPDFLLEDAFWERMQCKALSPDEKKFTELIVKMLKEWAKSTPLHRGLPVGCAISAVIANLALAEFDFRIERNIIPLYYGRYVDDVILVFENTNHFMNAEQVWKWVHERIPEIMISNTQQDTIEYVDQIVGHGEGASLRFEQKKTKLFVVDVNSGSLLLNAIERQINERSSEWRSLPDLPDTEQKLTSVLLSACDKAGVEVDSLRKVDVVSLRRAMFAMKVRDFESYCRNLSPSCWREARIDFLRMIKTYFTDVKSVFDLHQYLPRIISAACSCIDSDDTEAQAEVLEIVRRVIRSFDLIDEFVVSGCSECSMRGSELYSEWRQRLLAYFFSLISEWLTSTLPSISTMVNMEWKLRAEINGYREHACVCAWEDLFSCDLAYQPLRNWILKDKFVLREFSGLEIVYPTMRQLHLLKNPLALGIEKKCIDKLIALWHEMKYKGDLPAAFFFTVRPLMVSDIFHCVSQPPSWKSCRIVYESMTYLRGYKNPPDDMLPVPHKVPDHGADMMVQWDGQKSVINIALANWLTDDASYAAAVCDVADPDELQRFRRTMRLVNAIIASDVHPDYVVFPELSIPNQWFYSIASKLKRSHISLIAGVEYLHEQGAVRNQVWCSLMTDVFGFPDAYVVRFEKVHPAIHEEEELRKRAGVKLTSAVKQLRRKDKPILVRHGSDKKNLFFSTLICSDLLNVDYRQHLRGDVDLVFVPSWNQDVDLYASLVESTAFDLHAYIAVCNDRKYGDTRIRAPYRENYRRDVVKIKGGESDYFVIGKVDIDALRKFQSYQSSPIGDKALFKPVPIGYKISDERKILPQ